MINSCFYNTRTRFRVLVLLKEAYALTIIFTIMMYMHSNLENKL